MTLPRKRLISLQSTPYYHLITRCVRRAWLCGFDKLTGKSFEHRRDWMQNRLVELDKVFAIDLCAYSLMSNHYHLVVRVNQEEAQQWTEQEVISRWLTVFSGPVLVQRYLRGQCTTDAEKTAVAIIIEQWRERLCSISWFMRLLNESIARQANVEDNCKGRFWESRFKSQALLDETALITAMAYVDLNPVRAKIADTPEESDYTSIQCRIQYHKETGQMKQTPVIQTETRPALLDMSSAIKQQHDNLTKPPLTIGLTDYLQLVDWTGRAIRDDKRGYIPQNLPPIMHRLNIQPEYLVAYCAGKSKIHCTAIGSLHKLKKYAEETGKKWVHGLRLAPA